MARMSLDTAIRLSAEVKGGANITKVQRSLQDLAKGTQTTAKDMGTLRAATFQYARANDNTIAGLRNSITAFRGLQEQAKIGGREFNRYGAEIQKLEAKLRGLDSTAEKAGASLGQKLAAGLAAAGIGRALQGITQQAASFDAELRKAAAIEGGAGSFDVLRKSVESVAAAAAGTPAEVAALATALSRAGFSAKETAEAMDGIVKGAEATDTAFDRMGGIAATVLNTFGKNASDTGKVIDVMVKSANSANQTIEDLGEALSYSSSVASSLGVDMADLSGVIALLANAGIRGSRAGTTLSTGLNRLQIAAGGADSEVQDLTRGSAKMAEAMSRLGAEVLDAQGNLRPMDQVLVSLRRQMEGLSTTDRAILAKALFGEEAGRGFLALLSRSEEEITGMISKVRDSAGAADETRAAMDSFDLSMDRLGGNVQNVTNQIGGMIGAALKPLVDALNAALGIAAKLPDPVKQLGAAAAAAGLSVLGLVVAVNALKGGIAALGGMKAIIAGMTGFKTAADVATAAQVKLNLAVLANPYVLATAAIIAATVAAYKFIEPFRQFVDTYPKRFQIFWSSIAADAQASFRRITDAFDALGKFLMAGVQRIADNYATKFKWMRDRAGDALRAIGVDAEWLGGAMQGVATTIGNAFSSVFDFVQSKWKQTVSNMINYSNPLMAMLAGMGVNVGDAATAAMDYRAPTTWQQSGMFGGRASGAVPTPGSTTLPAPSAISTPIGATVGSGGSAGGGGRSAAGNDKGAEQLLQQQAAAQKQLEDFSDTRAKIAVQLTNELSLLGATTDEARRRLEFDIEVDAINTQNLQVKKDLAAIEEEITRLGGVAETSAIRRQVEREKEQALVNAQVKFEQEINDILLERARMMQGITQQAAEAPAFQTQGMKIEDQIGKLKEDLQEMTSIATLAGRSAEGIGNAFGNAFQDLITGAASARQALSNFFLDVAKNFAQMAAEIIAKQMQMIVLQTILKALGAVAGAASGGGDFAPSDTGPFGGAGLSTALSFDPSGFGRALGGNTATGRPYKVGENGPELFVPYQAGTIIPAEATEALEAINNASLRGLQVPFQAAAAASGRTGDTTAASTSSGLSVPFQRGMDGLSVPFQRSGMDGSTAAGGGSGVIDVKFETVRIGELDFVTRDEAQRIGRDSAKQGAALAQKRLANNPTARRSVGLS